MSGPISWKAKIAKIQRDGIDNLPPAARKEDIADALTWFSQKVRGRINGTDVGRPAISQGAAQGERSAPRLRYRNTTRRLARSTPIRMD
ncbi:hypothetical protein JCM21900_001008 [Sporobolomyces salmonicolor]